MAEVEQNQNSINTYRKLHNYVKTPTVFQMEATECGAASFSMILKYYGSHIPLEKLRIDTGVSRDGCNAKNIKRAAEKYGLECRAFTKGFEKMMQLKPPFIMHWNFNHFVVFEGVKHGYAYINDPALGRRKLTLEELDDGFTGVVLIFSKTEEFRKTKKPATILEFVKKRLNGEKKTILGLLFIGLLLFIPGLILPVLSQSFVDDILIGGNYVWMEEVIIAMIAVLVFQAFFTWLKGKILLKYQVKISLTSAYKFVGHMLKLPISFFEQRYVGDLGERVGNNNNVNSFFSNSLAEVVLDALIAILYFGLMLIYSPILTAIGAFGIIINLLTTSLVYSNLKDLSIKGEQDQGKYAGTIYSGLCISSTLKAAGAENDFASRVLGYQAKTANVEQKIGRMNEVLTSIPNVVSKCINIAILMIGATFVIDGDMTAGMLMAFSELLGSATAPVNSLIGFFQQIQTLKADFVRVEDIERYKIDEVFESGKTYKEMNSKLSGMVEIKSLQFGYSSLYPPLIEDYSFTLEPGKTVAFVGGSGSGKSTVAKLISGLMAPWSGEILFDGVNIEEIPPNIRNMSIATVSQSISLFSGTIRENLTLWNTNIREEDIIKACKDACIHNTIMQFTGGYDHVLAEGGCNLSGGQRQRLEIARALVLNPSILIIDEATSALDPIVEKDIMDNLKKRGCSIIIVAHRLSTIRDCDEIIVMYNGKIMQRGTHEELVQMEGLYSELIQNS